MLPIPSKIKQTVPQKVLESVKDEVFDLIYLLDVSRDKYEFISSPEKLLGYSNNMFYKNGSDFTLSLINPKDCQRVLFHFAEVLKNSVVPGKTISRGILFRMMHQNGNWVWISRTAVTYKEKQSYKVLGLVKDCSSLDNMEKSLIDKIEKGDKTLKHVRDSIKNDFLENIKFTKRELEVLKLICEGLSTKMIADKLGIAKNTVDVHRKNLHKKMEVHNSASLIKKISSSNI